MVPFHPGHVDFRVKMGGHESSKAFSEGCGAGDHVVDFDTDGWVPRTEGW